MKPIDIKQRLDGIAEQLRRRGARDECFVHASYDPFCIFCTLPVIEAAAQAVTNAEVVRAALVTLVGGDGRDELMAMEAAIRASVAPAVDKAAAIDAIQALLLTLPKEGQAS